jgi:magnesium transporter
MAANSRSTPSPLKGGASSSLAQAGRSSDAQAGNQGSQSTNAAEGVSVKRKRHKNKKRKNRRQSFAPQADIASASDMDAERPSLDVTPGPRSANRSTFYRLKQGGNSNTSLDSTTLLDHR